MKYKGLTLDKFQEQAIQAIDQNKTVVVSAPTGSGKTLIADYIINRDLQKGIKVIYTAPIKALSNQKYKEFTREYGEDKVGLITGDIVRNPTAPLIIMTTEIYRNMSITGDPALTGISYVVFDEIHYISDIERGTVWEESIIFSQPNIRFLCLSATIPNAEELSGWIKTIKGHDVELIKHHKRPVPLHISFFDTELGITTLENIKDVISIPEYHGRGRRFRRRRVDPPNHLNLAREVQTPCLFFTFSRAKTQQFAQELGKKTNKKGKPEIIRIIREKLSTAPKEINKLESTRILRETLPKGIGFHHAGLLPIIKELVEELFAQGLINILYTTETFAVGINMPAKTVCFESLRKFDGRTFRFLNSQEFFQIAGRAGRRGIDREGYVYSMMDRRDFEYKKIKNLTTKDTTPITSQFKLSINSVLNLINQHSKEEIYEILCKSLYAYQTYGPQFGKKHNPQSHAAFEKIKKKLEKIGYVTNNKLTWKGAFTSHIYADEIPIGEIFGTDLYKQLTHYQILLILASLVYEPRERTTFYKKYPSRTTKQLKHLLENHPVLKTEKRFKNINKLTAIVWPLVNGANLFKIMDNTNLLEGDVIRLLRQVQDRTHQIKTAAQDESLRKITSECQAQVTACMKEIEVL